MGFFTEHGDLFFIVQKGTSPGKFKIIFVLFLYRRIQAYIPYLFLCFRLSVGYYKEAQNCCCSSNFQTEPAPAVAFLRIPELSLCDMRFCDVVFTVNIS